MSKFYDKLRAEARANIRKLTGQNDLSYGVSPIARLIESEPMLKKRKRTKRPIKAKYGYKKNWRSSWAKDRTRLKNGRFKIEEKKLDITYI